MDEKDLIIQNLRRDLDKARAEVRHLRAVVVILKKQAEEMHRALKRLEMKEAGDDGSEQV